MAMLSKVQQFEVGKFYRVPCVLAHGRFVCGTGWVPVIGPPHEDAEIINFPDEHYHIDWRFAHARMLYRAQQVGRISEFGRVIMVRTNQRYGDPQPIVLDGPVMKRRLCRREFSTFPRMASWQLALDAAYRDCKLKPGMVCPHRGIPLESVRAMDGIVTCPGHGLRWNVETGELVHG